MFSAGVFGDGPRRPANDGQGLFFARNSHRDPIASLL